jgi:hypothetical protein
VYDVSALEVYDDRYLTKLTFAVGTKVLILEGLVVNKRRPKHNYATPVLSTLWTQDDLSFVPERYRIQLMFFIRVYCWTGARLSAFFADGLRYRDIDIVS